MPFAIHTVLSDHHYLVQSVGRDNPSIWIPHCLSIDTINGQTFVATFKASHSVTPVLIELFPHSWQSSDIVIPVMLFGPIKNLWPQEVHSYSRLMTVVRASSDNLRRTQPLKFAFCLASSHVVLHNVTFIGRILGSKSSLPISYAHALPRKPSKHYQKPRFTPLFPSPNSLSASFPLSPCWNWWAYQCLTLKKIESVCMKKVGALIFTVGVLYTPSALGLEHERTQTLI